MAPFSEILAKITLFHVALHSKMLLAASIQHFTQIFFIPQYFHTNNPLQNVISSPYLQNWQFYAKLKKGTQISEN